uniref:Uncharacterized protein n=1 Tax=Brugia malayi TaxID=6279 RepID=A8QDK1_BRUMA
MGCHLIPATIITHPAIPRFPPVKCLLKITSENNTILTHAILIQRTLSRRNIRILICVCYSVMHTLAACILVYTHPYCFIQEQTHSTPTSDTHTHIHTHQSVNIIVAAKIDKGMMGLGLLEVL